ncbi:MAG: methyltransferase domain-containing protein [Methylacidiphilales bacterium]|nr:methyltransferase domain-containing protein [Candidatus Methylacidiphilales bacterium]
MGISGNLEARQIMVQQQIRAVSVLDKKILAAIGDIPRELFFDNQLSSVVYADAFLPLPLNEKSLPPSLVGRMLQALGCQLNDSVLVIGFGSGYLTACLSKLCAKVVAIDLHHIMKERASLALEKLAITNVTLLHADASDIYETIPNTIFDGAVICGAINKKSIKHFLPLIRLGGTIVLIEGDPEQPIQSLKKLTVTEAGINVIETFLCNTRVDFLKMRKAN